MDEPALDVAVTVPEPVARLRRGRFVWFSIALRIGRTVDDRYDGVDRGVFPPKPEFQRKISPVFPNSNPAGTPEFPGYKIAMRKRGLWR